MRPFRIVDHPPLLNQQLCFPKRIKQFSVQQFIPELTIKGLTVLILSGTARGDVDRFSAQAAEPAPESFGNPLRAIV